MCRAQEGSAGSVVAAKRSVNEKSGREIGPTLAFAIDESRHYAYSCHVPPTPQPAAVLPLAPPVALILLALAGGPAHGYRIRADVIEHSGGTVTIDPGSLYRLIARLVDDGLIAEVPPASRPEDDDARRRYYRLTRVGRRLLRAETDRMADLVAVIRARGARRPRPV
jgi:DNA-binding PadR family transcriptional regulator